MDVLKINDDDDDDTNTRKITLASNQICIAYKLHLPRYKTLQIQQPTTYH